MNGLRRMLRGESGQILPAALIMLVLGTFLVIPVISLMTTNLSNTRQIDQASLELYAADAGVENMLWKIDDDPGILPAEGEANKKTINMQDQTMNGMSSVITTITNVGSRNYRLNSVATRPGGHNSEVETYINCLNFVNLLEGAITSLNDVELHNTNVTGQIYYGDDYQATGSDIIPTANNPLQREITNWPTWDDLSPLYLADVQGHEVTYSSWYLNQHTPCEIGPIYKDGSLTIDCNTSGLTLKLMGTLYVTGNLSFAQSKNYTIDLNGQTMFVHGTGTGNAISMASNSITLKGSGCIIANGDIQFKPGMDAGNDDEYVLVMSLTGKTYMQPNGTFYGSLVGDSEVEIQNGTLTWTDPTNHDLNFPGNEIGATVPVDGAGTVVSYIIK